MPKKKTKNLITIVGETSDGKQVVDGIWKTFETHGIPLDNIFDLCIHKGWMPDWTMLYEQMRNSGMEHGRILSKLEEAINDSFKQDFCAVVIFRLEQTFNQI
jgi:hypothetical protein